MPGMDADENWQNDQIFLSKSLSSVNLEAQNSFGEGATFFFFFFFDDDDDISLLNEPLNYLVN